MIGLLLKSFLALGRHALTKQQPRLQLLQLQNFIPVASTNFYSSGTTIIARINSCQQSMLYGSSQAWFEEKIRKIFFVRSPYKNLLTCSIASPVEKNSTVMERVKAQHLHVCYRKVFIKSVTCNQASDLLFMVFKELYKKEYFFFLIFLIHLFFAKPRDLG